MSVHDLGDISLREVAGRGGVQPLHLNGSRGQEFPLAVVGEGGVQQGGKGQTDLDHQVDDPFLERHQVPIVIPSACGAAPHVEVLPNRTLDHVGHQVLQHCRMMTEAMFTY